MDTRIEPFKEKFIKDIKFEDYKVAVSGMVINQNEKSFFLDDGTGQILITCDEIPSIDFVKVFGRLIPYEDHYELQAEVIQDLSNVDKELLKRVKEMLRD